MSTEERLRRLGLLHLVEQPDELKNTLEQKKQLFENKFSNQKSKGESSLLEIDVGLMASLEKAKKFAEKAHADQCYGDKPYFFHLQQVVDLLLSYGVNAQIIGYLHDVVEDTEVTLETIENEFGVFIARCVGVVTDEDGQNRSERKRQTHLKMSKVRGEEELALIVKVADRLANVKTSICEAREDKFQMYKNEQKDFYKAVYRKDLCEDLWLLLLKAIEK